MPLRHGWHDEDRTRLRSIRGDPLLRRRCVFHVVELFAAGDGSAVGGGWMWHVSGVDDGGEGGAFVLFGDGEKKKGGVRWVGGVRAVM